MKARLENYRLEKARKGREAWEGLEKFDISVLNMCGGEAGREGRGDIYC